MVRNKEIIVERNNFMNVILDGSLLVIHEKKKNTEMAEPPTGWEFIWFFCVYYAGIRNRQVALPRGTQQIKEADPEVRMLHQMYFYF